MDSRDLTLAEARRLFSYDPLTGVLTRIACADVSKLGPCLTMKRGYLYVKANGRRYYGHRLAWLLHYGRWPEGQIDHMNREKADNRICNLRDVDSSVNNHNRPEPQRNSTSGVRGVHKRWGIFIAQINAGGKKRHIGCFKTIEEAEAAYIAEKKRLHPGYLP